MNRIIIILTLLILLVMVSACSKSAKPRTFKLTLGSITGIEIAGGALLKAVNASSGEVIMLDLTVAPYTAVIPNGDWSFYLVGFAGPSLWQGTAYCGEAGKALTGGDIDITINALATTCANLPYTELIATKVTAWDSSLWDLSKWGP